MRGLTKAQREKCELEEDRHWLELIRRQVDGLAAFAEARAEGCESVWMGMQGLLEELKDTVKMMVEDLDKRLKGEEK